MLLPVKSGSESQMAPNLRRVAEAAFSAAVLDVTLGAMRSHSFYPTAVGLHLVFEFGDFFVIAWLAAYIATRQVFRSLWVQMLVFFVVGIVPSFLSYVLLYQTLGGTSFDQQDGNVLVYDYQITNAGLHELAISMATSIVLVLVSTLIYFRKGSDFKSSN